MSDGCGCSGDEMTYRFVCPDCGTSPMVDAAIRRDILECGCYLCGRPAETRDFVTISVA
ncbi:MAG: DUF7560 family zinc ribbon protein [Halobacteriota archaeon]